MSDKVEVSKSLVLGYHKDACKDFQLRIEKDFPRFFEKDRFVRFKEGNWYSAAGSSLLFYVTKVEGSGNTRGYGFNCGEWADYRETLKVFGNSNSNFSDRRFATIDEVSKALRVEADRRGLLGDVKLQAHAGNGKDICEPLNSGGFLPTISLYNEGGDYKVRLYNYHGVIFEDGQWAEVQKVVELTKAEIEERLGFEFKLKLK